ncbi:kelch-like protein 8 [Anneissia japonica]|uniref:kelch-like protein 8 n=1 Tax=Anneissia japonica TaxID=1529436 RepID=UPI0014258CFC|nr:kelch-like protein 8 [Anneissia japonica]
MADASLDLECTDVTEGNYSEERAQKVATSRDAVVNGINVSNPQTPEFDAVTVFTDTSLAHDLLLVLHEHRKLEQLTDVTLNSGDLNISCHRSVLAASSTFFRAMFLDDLRESHEKVIHLHDVKPDMLEKIIDYLYLGCIEIRLSFAGDLLATACFLQYPKLVAECESFLKLHLNPSNCLGIHELADLYNRQHLMEDSWDYILANFMNVSLSKDFLSIKKEKLIHLISDKRLRVNREEIVLNACLKWVDFEPCRTKDFISVLKCVKLAFVDTAILNDVLMSSVLFINVEECRDLIKDSLNLQEMMVKEKQIRQPRSSMLQDVTVVVGGMTSDRKWQKEVIFYHEECWYFLTKLPFDHTDYTVTSIKEDMYIIGGFCEDHVCNYVWRYSFANNKWKQICGLQNARCNHASVSLNGKIYVVAGEDDANSLTNIELYDPGFESWSVIGDINPINSNLSLAAMQNKLYIVGPLTFTRVCSLQVFDLETLECTVILTSGMTRSMFPVVTLQHNLFLLGNCKMKEVMILDPDTMQMVASEPMRYKRNCPTATIVNGKIVVTGGELQQHVNKVESFDPLLNKWVGETPMPTGLCFHGCVAGLKYIGPPFSWIKLSTQL